MNNSLLSDSEATRTAIGAARITWRKVSCSMPQAGIIQHHGTCRSEIRRPGLATRSPRRGQA